MCKVSVDLLGIHTSPQWIYEKLITRKLLFWISTKILCFELQRADNHEIRFILMLLCTIVSQQYFVIAMLVRYFFDLVCQSAMS